MNKKNEYGWNPDREDGIGAVTDSESTQNPCLLFCTGYCRTSVQPDVNSYISNLFDNFNSRPRRLRLGWGGVGKQLYWCHTLETNINPLPRPHPHDCHGQRSGSGLMWSRVVSLIRLGGSWHSQHPELFVVAASRDKNADLCGERSWDQRLHYASQYGNMANLLFHSQPCYVNQVTLLAPPCPVAFCHSAGFDLNAAFVTDWGQ